jgi:hypothetical protein
MRASPQSVWSPVGSAPRLVDPQGWPLNDIALLNY